MGAGPKGFVGFILGNLYRYISIHVDVSGLGELHPDPGKHSIGHRGEDFHFQSMVVTVLFDHKLNSSPRNSLRCFRLLYLLMTAVKLVFSCNLYFSSCSFSGLNLVESYPYEPVQKGYDYVRLASITAGMLANYEDLTFFFLQYFFFP